MGASKVNDLFLLGKIWGFLKYFHPNIAAGKFDWDKELVDFLPKFLAASSKKERDELLLNWINSLGDIPSKKAADYTTLKNFKSKPDFSWISSQNFSPVLKEKLTGILDNRADSDQYYIKFHRQEGLNIPEFIHEKSYSSPACPSFPRFLQGAEKVKKTLDIKNTSLQNEDDFMLVKGETKGKFFKISINDIDYIEGMKNYAGIVCGNKKIVSLLNLKDLEEKLPAGKFIRVHKSYIISVAKINTIEGNSNLLKDHLATPVIIGETYKSVFLEKMKSKLIG